MKSFLTDRKQYVSIDSMNSDILPSPQCSCIQGSKMSSLLYIIYTNEIPLLSKIMHSNTLTTLTGNQPYTNDNDINTFTIQYVDDSTNMISSKDISVLQEYINTFFLLLESYYDINKLSFCILWISPQSFQFSQQWPNLLHFNFGPILYHRTITKGKNSWNVYIIKPIKYS